MALESADSRRRGGATSTGYREIRARGRRSTRETRRGWKGSAPRGSIMSKGALKRAPQQPTSPSPGPSPDCPRARHNHAVPATSAVVTTRRSLPAAESARPRPGRGRASAQLEGVRRLRVHDRGRPLLPVQGSTLGPAQSLCRPHWSTSTAAPRYVATGLKSGA